MPSGITFTCPPYRGPAIPAPLQYLRSNLLGGSSYSSDLEETIITTLRQLRREMTQRRGWHSA
ncbi:hypothetical protein IE4872_CH00514 [Rhizobium gallicum]|uniref:Uncharacterized protein n=1 Tax=Rhizobium gallicum TaxID=56730 RepID=A0A1L5NEA4_9HYPH|nr:hypothetical protein IE4872_CH00514 [Rhizobium gallicum]